MNETVIKMQSLNLDGNVIPHNWYQSIVLKSGKPDLSAIVILSDIVYWYRPTSVFYKDGTFKGIKQKFDGDVLQKSYDDLANKFGMTKRTVRDAIVRLEELNLVKREFRNIMYRGTHLSNVLYLHLNFEEVSRITVVGVTVERNTPHVETSEVYTQKRQTYTNTTTNTTTNITTDITTNNNKTNGHSTNDHKTKKNKVDNSVLKDDFERIWEMYPNKKGKAEAEKHYKKAIKDGITNEQIEKGINAYVDECNRLGTKKQYMKHGSTFFNQRSYLDDFITEDEVRSRHENEHENYTEGLDW